jgi:hypothetical protein
MKVLTFSRHFHKGHPKAGQPTFFVEKVMACLADRIPDWTMYDHFTQYDWYEYYNCTMPKGHIIRAGHHWKPGDMASLRIWSDKPYRSKQIEFAQVEVKKVWDVEIWTTDGDRMSIGLPEIPGVQMRLLPIGDIATNDGLEYRDFEEWFNVHPKKKHHVFTGQIICWSPKISY